MRVIKSNFIYTTKSDDFEVRENEYVVIEEGKVKEFLTLYHGEYTDYTSYYMIPSFVNLHTHAPQFTNRGIGYDEKLLPWLESYTFPKESNFSKEEYCKLYYKRFAKDLVRNGTLNAVIFGTIHLKGNQILADCLENEKIFAYVGKVNMVQNAPEYLKELEERSYQDTVDFIGLFEPMSRIQPIITPRFAPSVSSRLLQRLGDLAIQKQVPVQSHLDENIDEIKWVKELFPEDRTYADVYYNRNLLGQTKTIMAHCIHMNEEEIRRFEKRDVYIAHCPTSNLNLGSGIAPIKKYLKKGLHIGMGTDVAGGNSESMTESIVSAIQCSKMYSIYVDPQEEPLRLSEVFYFATKGGGKFFGKVGSFETGYDFNALVIDDENLNIINQEDIKSRLEAFIYAGDDRNIYKRLILGEEID